MSAISKVIKSFDQSDALAQAQKEAVSALAALGGSKAEMFAIQIQESLLPAGNGTNLIVPISTVLKRISDVRAYSSSEADNIGSVVSNTLSTFLKGTRDSIVAGVGNLISDTLGVFLGNGGASSGTIEEYYVATEGMSVIRVDMKAWYQNVTASSIQTKMERVTAVVATKSVVNLAKIDFSTFLNLYEQQLVASGIDSNQMKAALQEAKAIYTDFKSVMESKLTNSPEPKALRSSKTDGLEAMKATPEPEPALLLDGPPAARFLERRANREEAR